MLAQTTGRHWNVGEISKIPWNTDLAEITESESTAKDAAGDLLAAESMISILHITVVRYWPRYWVNRLIYRFQDIPIGT